MICIMAILGGCFVWRSIINSVVSACVTTYFALYWITPLPFSENYIEILWLYRCLHCTLTQFLFLQADDNSDLTALETLLNEFFALGTIPARQREIEAILLGFGSQQGAWNHCLNFLSRSSNHYVSMFCLTTVEVIASSAEGLEVLTSNNLLFTDCDSKTMARIAMGREIADQRITQQFCTATPSFHASIFKEQTC